jgi:hypothetical protein
MLVIPKMFHFIYRAVSHFSLKKTVTSSRPTPSHNLKNLQKKIMDTGRNHHQMKTMAWDTTNLLTSH